MRLFSGEGAGTTVNRSTRSAGWLSWSLYRATARFLRCVEADMRLTGVSFDDAARSVMARFSIQKLDSLVEDLLDSAFGADEHAKQ